MSVRVIYILRRIGCVCILFMLTACASLLPDGKHESPKPWSSYFEAQWSFARIIPNKTNVTELKAMGIELGQTPNISVLSQADILKRLLGVTVPDVRLLDQSLQECIRSGETCYAIEIEQTHVERKRTGNFWLDFFNFHRTTEINGWKFDAIIVIRNETVIYKLWSGKPLIRQVEEERYPLGPFQGAGTSVMTYAK